ncbi:MAG: prepilin peptidase [Amphiplicatus sp.]
MSFIWAAFAALLCWAAICDARTYRIPNWISAALAGLFAVAAIASGAALWDFWPHLAVGAGAFAIGYLLYLFTNMGAGDAKLAAAVALWAGASGLYALVVALAVAMAILALGLVALRLLLGRLLKTAPAMRILTRGAPAPLGVAISAAAIVASARFDGALWAF